MDAATGAVNRVLVLQFNPDSLSRTLQSRGVATDVANRSEAMRLTGPAIEIIKLDAELDAADQLDAAGSSQSASSGLHPQLAALESLVNPTSGQLQATNRLAQAGTLEIAPMQAPLTLFVWGKNRILPVRITDFSITEEAFDADLNPIRAKVSLSMRVLSVDDLGFAHRGGSLFMAYLQQKERLASTSPGGSLTALGISGLP